jgi:hypothetical protein
MHRKRSVECHPVITACSTLYSLRSGLRGNVPAEKSTPDSIRYPKRSSCDALCSSGWLEFPLFFCKKVDQWPRGLRSSAAQTLRTSVRIPPKAWISVRVSSVFVLFYVGSGLATGLIPPSKESCRMSIMNKLHSSRIILMGNRPEGLIRKMKEESRINALQILLRINCLR